MNKKSSMGNFDLKDFKEKMQEVKDAVEQAKVEYEINGSKEEVANQPLGQKILGIVILIALLVGTGWMLFLNADMMFLPKNSITIVVEDQNGEHIKGVGIRLTNMEDAHIYTYEDVDNLTLLDMKSGKYMLTFEEIPEGYEIDSVVDTIELQQDGKVKVEYICKEK